MISERIVNLGVLLALVLGIALYNVVPFSDEADAVIVDALVDEEPQTTTTTVAATDEGDVESGGAAPAAFGSAVAALEQGVTAEQVVSAPSPVPEPIEGPSCPAEVVDRAATALASAVGSTAAAVNDLVAIAEGCSNADATTGVIALAGELGPLTPLTLVGLDQSLAPVLTVIERGCADLGETVVLASVFPAAAGPDLVASLAAAEAFCDQVARS